MHGAILARPGRWLITLNGVLTSGVIIQDAGGFYGFEDAPGERWLTLSGVLRQLDRWRQSTSA